MSLHSKFIILGVRFRFVACYRHSKGFKIKCIKVTIELLFSHEKLGFVPEKIITEYFYLLLTHENKL